MPLPTFLIIGAAKSGTSSLYEYLRQHPQVFMSATKETNFFALEGQVAAFRGPGDDREINRHSITDLRTYLAQFDGVTSEVAIGEASPLYLYSATAPERIEHHVRDVRLVAVLRDPVDRAFASFVHLRRDGREPCADFATALSAEDERVRQNWEFMWHYTRVSRYAEQVARYIRRFGRDRLLVFTQEDLDADTVRVVKDVYAFIGVDEGFEPDVSERYNAGGMPRSRAFQRFLNGSALARSIGRAVLSEERRQKVFRSLYRLNLSRAELDPALRRELVTAFHDDVRALEQLLDRDLSEWLR